MKMKTIDKLREAYSDRILKKLWSHWFNPLYTIYFNFIFFPLRQAIKFPVFIYGWPKLFSQFGTMECIGKCETGMVRINVTIPYSPQCAVGNTQLNIKGKIIFRGKCEIGTGNKINVEKQGILELGDDTKILTFCNVSAYTKMSIGAHSRIAHRCQIFDANFHYVADFNKHIVRRFSRKIFIGEYCWICNSSTISSGAIIPDKTIVASNSLVGKDFSSIPPESIIGGIPAKLISTGHRRVESRKFLIKIMKFFEENPMCNQFNIDLDTPHSICDVDDI